jgi:AcrR family transcriptional regulator
MTKTNVQLDVVEGAEYRGKRERAKVANRDAILASADRVFAQLGFEATTVRDIIRGTDLAAGTFYNYFKSKEEIFAALSDDRAARFLPVLKTARLQASSLEMYLQSAFHAYFSFLAYEFRGGDRAIVERRPYVRPDTPGIQAAYDEVRHGITEAIRRGLAPPVDAGFLTGACIGIAEHIGETMLIRKPVDIEAATKFALSFILKGVNGAPRGD